MERQWLLLTVGFHHSFGQQLFKREVSRHFKNEYHKVKQSIFPLISFSSVNEKVQFSSGLVNKACPRQLLWHAQWEGAFRGDCMRQVHSSSGFTSGVKRRDLLFSTGGWILPSLFMSPSIGLPHIPKIIFPALLPSSYSWVVAVSLFRSSSSSMVAVA